MKIRQLLSQPTFSLITCLVAASACESADGDASSDSVKASDVSFDNDQTDLNSTNAQDALIEISTMTDFADRIIVFDVSEDLTGALVDVEAGCTEQTMAIGGGCSTNFPDATLFSSELRDNSYLCEWKWRSGEPIQVSARVVCLSLVP